MNFITTTQLRTQTTRLTKALKNGEKVSLVHRSKVVGVIEPELQNTKKTFDISGFKKLVKELNLPRMTYAQREKAYRMHIEEKYGKYIR